MPSDQLRGTPLFDEFVEGDLAAGALAFANKVIAEGRPLACVVEYGHVWASFGEQPWRRFDLPEPVKTEPAAPAAPAPGKAGK